MKEYIYRITLIGITVFMISCSSTEQKTVVTAPPVKVVVRKVVAYSGTNFLSVSGKIQASKSADISTSMMGYVTNVYVNVGDTVGKGDLLISINNAALKAKKAQVTATITKARTAFNISENNYKRYVSLFASASVTQKEIEDATANMQIAKADLEAANQMINEVNAQFAYTNIKAPFSGVITRKNITIGDMANPGASLISIENATDLEVSTLVPETEISTIKKGAEVAVTIKSLNKTITGKVVALSSSSTNTGGQYLVKIQIEKTALPILSGMFTTVQFSLEKDAKSAVVLVPLTAIITKGQLSGLYTVSETDTALLRWLRLGKIYGNEVAVLSGLNTEESYIIAAEGKLFNGAKVSIQ